MCPPQHALGGTVQLNCPDFKGPHLGLKPAQKSPLKIATTAKPGLTETSGQASLRSCSSRNGVTPAPANSPLPAVATPAEAPQSPQTSPVPNQSSSPVYDSSAPSSPCFDASAGDGSIATIPSVNDAAIAQLPPPPFDESAARWGSGQRKKPQLPAPTVARAGTAGSGQRLPPPAYREINGGSWPAKNTTVAAATKPDDVSPRFRERCASKTTPAQEASRPTLSARAMVAAALPKFARRRRVPCPSLRRSELRNKRTVRVRVALWRLRRLPPTFPRNRPRLRVHLHARRRRQHPRSYPPDLRPRAPPPGQGRPRP